MRSDRLFKNELNIEALSCECGKFSAILERFHFMKYQYNISSLKVENVESFTVENAYIVNITNNNTPFFSSLPSRLHSTTDPIKHNHEPFNKTELETKLKNLKTENEQAAGEYHRLLDINNNYNENNSINDEKAQRLLLLVVDINHMSESKLQDYYTELDIGQSSFMEENKNKIQDNPKNDMSWLNETVVSNYQPFEPIFYNTSISCSGEDSN